MPPFAVTPHQVWGSWTLDPTVLIGLGGTGWLYGRGVRRLWRAGRPGRGIGGWQAAAFGAGLVAVAVALVSPLDAMSHALLSAHMVQHLLLMVVAPPLLVLGHPGLAAGAALPPRWRGRVHRVVRARWVDRVRGTAAHPGVAWTVAACTLLVWHVPVAYDGALRDPVVHAAEHATFLGASLLFWWTALRPALRGRPRAIDVLLVISGGLPGAALGAMLTFAAIALYPAYRLTVGAWGLTPLQDQQLAGAIMWIPSGLVYLGAAAALFVRWLRAVERDGAAAEDRPLDRTLVRP